MKVLLASSSSGSRGGGEVYLVYLAHALAHRGHQLTIWLSADEKMDELAALLAPAGRVVRSLYPNTYDRGGRSLSAFLDRRMAAKVAAEWKELEFDCLHLNKQNLEDGLDLVRAARLVKRPSVCTIHLTQSAQYLGAKMPWVRDAVSRHVLRGFRGPFITVLEERSRDLARFLGRRKKRIVTIPNGVPLPSRLALANARDKTRAILDVAPQEILVIAVGRMVRQKRPLLFVDLARRMGALVPNARFLWVGDGPLAGEWDETTRGDPLIQREPWQTSVTPFLAAADVFLHVAEYEGLPLALLEAMAAGLPCAVTPNLLQELPFLDNTNSVAADPAALDWMNPLRDPARRSQLGDNARRLVEHSFSYDRMAQACEALYREETGNRL